MFNILSIVTPTLIQRLRDPRVKKVSLHEVARELTRLYNLKDIDGVRELRDAYFIGQGRLYPVKTLNERRAVVDENLMSAAGLVDVVASCGHEASGQLQVKLKLDGPVAQFYQEATGP